MAGKPNVPASLEQALALYRDRNGAYKDCWVKTGAVLSTVFDKTDLRTADDYTKFQLVNMIISKVIRYAASNMTHQDSVDDLVTYAAMLAALNKSTNDNKDTREG